MCVTLTFRYHSPSNLRRHESASVRFVASRVFGTDQTDDVSLVVSRIESVRCSPGSVRYKQHSVFLESFEVKCIDRVACFFPRVESTVRISSVRETKVLFLTSNKR